MSQRLGKPVAPSKECNPCRLSAVRGHCGRPNNTVSYQYGDVRGDTLAEFVAAWEASGGKTWIGGFDGTGPGECHWYCPALDGEDFIIDGEVQAEFVSKPNPRVGEPAFDLMCPPLKAPMFATKREADYSVTCWHQVFYEAGVDNTFTSFRDTNATITAVFDDGCPDATFEIPDATGGWTNQINAISAGIADILPKSLQNSSYCTIPNTDPPVGCAGLPTPAIFLPDMKWRYAGFRICPGDKAPVDFIYNSDQRKGIRLDYNIKASEIKYFDRCFDCVTGQVIWIDCATNEEYDGELVDGKPPCAIPCTKEFPSIPNAPVCQSGIITGCVFDADGAQQVGGVTEVFKFCEGDDEPQVQLIVDFGEDSQEEVELQDGWYFGDCATGNPITPEVETTKPGYQTSVTYTTKCTAIVSSGRYTTAPDAPTDLTGVSLIGEDLDGNEIIYFEDPVDQSTWIDYCNGRIEQLIAQSLSVPYEFSCEIVDSQLNIVLKVCDENLQTIGLSFAGGDATIDYSTEQMTVQETGTLVVFDGQKCVFDCFGNVVDEYEIVKPDEDCPVIGVVNHCVLVATGDAVDKKTGYSVSDFDPGDLVAGDDATCTFSIAVDDPSPTIEIKPINGYIFTETSPGNFSAGFIYDGGANPNEPLEATITLSTGEQHVLTGDDFYLCSGGNESLNASYEPQPVKQDIKELCYEGKPSAWQAFDGTVLNYDDLVFCDPTSDCVSESLPGNWCDITLSADPDIDDVINANNILVSVETCGSNQSLEYFVAGENGVLVPYKPIGEIVDCDTYEPPQPEPPACPESANFKQVCTPANGYGILDNSNFVGSPTPHLQNGTALVMDLIHEDGSVTTIGPLADPYYTGFKAALEAALPECQVVYVCANHTSPRGCNAAHVANLAAYPAYDAPSYPADVQNNLSNPDQSELWASGWLIDCGGCASPIVRAEISGSSNPDYIGAFKDIINYKGVEEQYFRAVTCEGVFWKDLKGNDIPAPASACCAVPVGDPKAVACLEEVKNLLSCTDCPELVEGVTTNTADDSVVDFSQPVSISGGFINHTTPLTIDDKTGCLAANPDAPISVEYLVDHEAGPFDSHRAYILTTSAGTFTAMSASNTQPQSGTAGIGSNSIFIGYNVGEPGNQRNIRTVKITATASEWLAGISLSALGFGGVGGATETIHSRSIMICDGLSEICDGC